MAAPDLKWVEFKDFSPGIWNAKLATSGVSVPAPPGAATDTNTFRCIALPGGGLGPLPKRTSNFTRALFDTPKGGTPIYITGLKIAGPILSTGTSSGGNTETFLSFEYIYDNAGSDQRRFRLIRLRDHTSGRTEDIIKSINSAEASPAAQFRAVPFALSRSNQTTPTNPGYPVMVWGWYAGGGSAEMIAEAFPNDTAPTVTGVKSISAAIRCETITHQGRVLLLERTAYNFGAGGQFSTNENVYYTNVNNVATLSSTAAVFVPENPTGYGAWSSMSAGELFLVKTHGGGMTLNGDISNPTVVKLPNVQSTGQFGCVGANTQIGFLYTATSQGAWVWNGGDTSALVSPQLEGDFWQHSTATDKFIGMVTAQHARWGDWVLVSNNWVFDTNSGAWWRLEDTTNAYDTCWAFDTSWNGRKAFGVPSDYDNAADTILFEWDQETPALSYSWQSHPIRETIDRLVNVRQIVLTAQGSGTVTITLTGLGGTTQAESFTVSSASHPVVIRKPTALYGSNIVVRIQSDGGSDPAPVVWGVQLGIDERMRVAAS